MSEFPHLKERLEALVQRDVARRRRLWDQFKTWSYADLKAALDRNREELSYLNDTLLVYYDKELEKQGVEAVEIAVPDSPISARRIDVPTPLLEADIFGEMDWEYNIPGTLAWQWEWVERKIRGKKPQTSQIAHVLMFLLIF